MRLLIFILMLFFVVSGCRHDDLTGWLAFPDPRAAQVHCFSIIGTSLKKGDKSDPFTSMFLFMRFADDKGITLKRVLAELDRLNDTDYYRKFNLVCNKYLTGELEIDL